MIFQKPVVCIWWQWRQNLTWGCHGLAPGVYCWWSWRRCRPPRWRTRRRTDGAVSQDARSSPLWQGQQKKTCTTFLKLQWMQNHFNETSDLIDLNATGKWRLNMFQRHGLIRHGFSIFYIGLSTICCTDPTVIWWQYSVLQEVTGACGHELWRAITHQPKICPPNGRISPLWHHTGSSCSFLVFCGHLVTQKVCGVAKKIMGTLQRNKRAVVSHLFWISGLISVPCSH